MYSKKIMHYFSLENVSQKYNINSFIALFCIMLHSYHVYI